MTLRDGASRTRPQTPFTRRAPVAALSVPLMVVLWLAGCAAVAPPPAATPVAAPAAAPAAAPSRIEQAGAACRALREDIERAVPPGESIRALGEHGVVLAGPLVLPPGKVPRPSEPSATAVQAQIDANGHVVAGSAHVLRSIGDAALGPAIAEAVPALRFTLDADAAARAPIAFTTIYAVCATRPAPPSAPATAP